MKTYDDIASAQLAIPVRWGGNMVTTISGAHGEISVDAEAEMVTVVDPKTKRTIHIPFDNVVCLEKAPPPKPVEVKTFTSVIVEPKPTQHQQHGAKK